MKTKVKNILTTSWMEDMFSAVFMVVLGLLVGAVILAFVAPNNIGTAFGLLVTGGFTNTGFAVGMGRLLYYAAPFILSGLSVGISFKAGVFNIGVQGQFQVGALTAVIVSITTNSVFGSFTWIAAMIGGGIAASLYAMIPAALYVTKGANIIIVGIMLNYLAPLIMNPIIQQFPTVYDSAYNWTFLMPEGSSIPTGGVGELLGGTNANISIIIAVALCILIYWMFKKTTLGYEMKVCGLSVEAAKYSGISDKRTSMVTFIIAGFIAGMSGAVYYCSGSGTHYILSDSLMATGATGIPVALLGMTSPIGIIFSGLFMAYLQVGGTHIQTLGIDIAFVTVVSSVIIFFCAFTSIPRKLYRKLLHTK